MAAAGSDSAARRGGRGSGAGAGAEPKRAGAKTTRRLAAHRQGAAIEIGAGLSLVFRRKVPQRGSDAQLFANQEPDRWSGDGPAVVRGRSGAGQSADVDGDESKPGNCQGTQPASGGGVAARWE